MTIQAQMTGEDRGEALTHALEKAFGMEAEDAAAVSEIVASQFGDHSEVPDSNLDAEVRAVFYTLEAKKLLAFRREDVPKDVDGKTRAFYWRLRVEEIQRVLAETADASEPDVYAAIPADVWARHAAA